MSYNDKDARCKAFIVSSRISDRLSRRSWPLWRRLMRIRRRRTSERGLSQEAQEGKKNHLRIAVGFVYSLQNLKPSCTLIHLDGRQGRHHRGEGRQPSGKGNAAPRAPRDANPVQLAAAHPHRRLWNCPPNLWSSLWSQKYQEELCQIQLSKKGPGVWDTSILHFKQTKWWFTILNFSLCPTVTQLWRWWKQTRQPKSRTLLPRRFKRKRRCPGPGKRRRTTGGKDLTTALAPIPAHAGGAHAPGNFYIRDNEGGCIWVSKKTLFFVHYIRSFAF